MTKKDFAKKFENSEIISDPELIFDLLNEAETALRAYFDRDPDSQNTVIQMANFILNTEIVQDEYEDDEVPE